MFSQVSFFPRNQEHFFKEEMEMYSQRTQKTGQVGSKDRVDLKVRAVILKFMNIWKAENKNQSNN